MYPRSQFASCAEEEAGDALAWDSQVWDVYGKVRWMVRQKDDICQQQKRSFTIFPDRFSLSEALHLCQVICIMGEWDYLIAHFSFASVIFPPPVLMRFLQYIVFI